MLIETKHVNDIGQNNIKYSLRDMVKHPFFELAFRPFFILASLASLFALVTWLMVLNGHFVWQSSGISTTIWHIHEMLFGFAATVAVGFILTAAQTWTKQKSISGLSLMTYTLLWLLIRVCIYFNTSLTVIIAIMLQACWWLIAIRTFYSMVKKSNNERNFLFVPLLTAMMLLNIVILVSDFMGYIELAMHLSRAGILLFTLLMTILGGRVIPFFTQSGAKTNLVVTPQWLEILLIPMSLATVVFFIISYFIVFPFSAAPLMIMTGCLNLFRLFFWKTTQTLRIPLLWSLHLAYFLMGLGLIGLGLSYYQLTFLPVQISFSSALHVITIGAIGLMIFAMMSRVSLGHTGRMLVLNKAVVIAFVLLTASALVRAILPLFNQMLYSWNLSGLLWIVSVVVFLFIYVPVLSQKRQGR